MTPAFDATTPALDTMKRLKDEVMEEAQAFRDRHAAPLDRLMESAEFETMPVPVRLLCARTKQALDEFVVRVGRETEDQHERMVKLDTMLKDRGHEGL